MLAAECTLRLAVLALTGDILRAAEECVSYSAHSAGLSVLQQAAAFGYPSTVYAIRPKVTLCVPPWAWLIIGIAALALLVAGMSFHRPECWQALCDVKPIRAHLLAPSTPTWGGHILRLQE